jgi:hypothetical protein
MTSDLGSFARRTIVERKPKIVSQVIEANDLEQTYRDALELLLREMLDGTITDPLDDTVISPDALLPEERAAWKGEIALHRGRSWLDVPWYFAESFFYLKLLAACGWFDRASARFWQDPFAPLKEKELSASRGGIETARMLTAACAGLDPGEATRARLLASLWGNRVDLSNFELDEASRRKLFAHSDAALVVDHVGQALEALRKARQVHVVLDNAGPELVCDLLLADELAARGVRVTFHAKRMPFFVSDATAADVRATVEALARDVDPAVAATGVRLRARLADGGLAVSDHWFWTGPLHFTCLPPVLRGTLAAPGGLIVVKGDANYRRLLEDRKWETGRSLDDLAPGFPRPFICLRTLKSEIVVDVPAETAARLAQQDPEWLINGRRGIVRLCSRSPAQAVASSS